MKLRNRIFPDLPSRAPLAYSATFFMTRAELSFHWMLIAFCGQAVMQRLHPTQAEGSILALASMISMALWLHAFRQMPQPLQNFSATTGATVECCSILPA